MSAKKDTTLPPPPPPGLSPGTLQIKGKVLTITRHTDDPGGIVKLEVLKLLGIGSSTSAITTSDTLRANMTKLPATLKIGTVFKAGLIQQRYLSDSKKNSTNWSLIDVKNN